MEAWKLYNSKADIANVDGAQSLTEKPKSVTWADDVEDRELLGAYTFVK
jgi:hypothetical protein